MPPCGMAPVSLTACVVLWRTANRLTGTVEAGLDGLLEPLPDPLPDPFEPVVWVSCSVSEGTGGSGVCCCCGATGAAGAGGAGAGVVSVGVGGGGFSSVSVSPLSSPACAADTPPVWATTGTATARPDEARSAAVMAATRWDMGNLQGSMDSASKGPWAPAPLNRLRFSFDKETLVRPHPMPSVSPDRGALSKAQVHAVASSRPVITFL